MILCFQIAGSKSGTLEGKTMYLSCLNLFLFAAFRATFILLLLLFIPISCIIGDKLLKE